MIAGPTPDSSYDDRLRAEAAMDAPLFLIRAGDEALDEEAFGNPSLVASEVDAYADPQVPGSWALHAYFTQAPEGAWTHAITDKALQ